MSVIQINSKKELEKVLGVQKAVSDRARIELAEGFLKVNTEQFIQYVAKTLEKYARYATLTEYRALPHLANGEKWGASFGVTALIGAMILEHARVLIGVQSDLRSEYLRFLDTLAEPGKSNIDMDALTRIFAILSENYGLVWADRDNLALTVSGKRVYLHLLDAAKFVEEAAIAADRFKKKGKKNKPHA